MLPTDSKARKEFPMFEGLLVYFPDALAAVAYHSYINNEKHNPGLRLHWSRGKSDDHKNTIIRHMTDIACGGDEVEELKAVAWRALAALQLALEEKKVDGRNLQTTQSVSQGVGEKAVFSTEVREALYRGSSV